jgi:ppGpp synthetase/RelA/SpoT-type nucleotidyltranferase
MQTSLTSLAQEAIAGGSEVLTRLQGAFQLATKNNSKTIFYTRSRVKDPGSIVEKLFDRQAAFGAQYTIKSITDIVGYRLVVLYDDQLEAALSFAIQVLRNCYHSHDTLIADPELWSDIQEIKLFPRAPSDPADPYVKLHDELKANPGRIGKSVIDQTDKIRKATAEEMARKKSAYSSMHIIVYMNSYSQGSLKRIPLELQIRTAVEDIWSEISHENEYKVRRRNAWSPKLRELYDENNQSVGALKQQFNVTVPENLKRIRKTTKAIGSELDALRSSPAAGYGSHTLNLAFHIAKEMFGKAERDLFGKYDRSVVNIRDQYLQHANKDVSAADRKILSEFSGAMKVLKKIAELPLPDDQCQHNFRCLIRLEQIRLDAIRLRYLMRRPGKEDVRDQVKREADGLYSVLDQIESDRNLVIKPVAMIQFFKYYVVRYGSNAALASTHLTTCYSTLSIDPTIDRNGMIVVMASRALAESVWGTNEYLKNTMRENYQKALSLSIESKDKYEMRTKITGKQKPIDDLIFSTSPFQEQSCLNNVVMYAADCLLNGVEQQFFSEVGYSLDGLEADVGKLKAYLEKQKLKEEGFWHTVLIGFEALGKNGGKFSHHARSARKIAKALHDGKLTGCPFNELQDRIRSDICRVLDLAMAAPSSASPSPPAR